MINVKKPECDAAENVEPSGGNDLQRRITAHCKTYQGAQTNRSIIQLTLNLVLFGLTFAAMWWSLGYSYWLTALLYLPAAVLLVRLFIIQHDCGHRSFFKSNKINDNVGRVLSVLTVVPYDFWRRSHNIHHATSGNLDKRGVGDIDTLTIAEYKALPPLKRFGYRVYRNPLVLLLVGGPLHNILIHRVPRNKPLSFKSSWRSVMGSNLSLVLFYGLVGAVIGYKTLLIMCLPVLVIAAWVGGWLFFIQHQYEKAYWERNKDWAFYDAAVAGSSYYVLPKFLQWCTGNIGLHHIHHLCGSIPNYRLQECLDASPELQQMNRLTLMESLKGLHLALWDEEQKKLVSFAQV